MLQKYIPNTILSCMSYSQRCDLSFMRPQAKDFGYVQSKQLKFTNGCKIYWWTMELNKLFEFIEKTELTDLILISGDDDHLTDPNGTTLYNDHLNLIYSVTKFMPRQIKKWYSQNAEVSNNTMIPIPVGVCPPWSRGFSTPEQLKSIIFDCDRNKLLYSNFSSGTNVWKRPQILNIVKENLKDNCTIGEFTLDKNKIINYYKELQEHKYVLCPPGNSKESHRMWETLYTGGIPVVEDNASNRYFSNLFPILVVERWSDITKELLEEKYEYFINKEWRYDLLDCDNLFKEYGLS